MRALVQRAESARVVVDGQTIAEIARGLVVFLAVHRDDEIAVGDAMIRKLLGLRIFEDENGKMGRSVVDVAGDLLIVSQFTLYGDCNKGTRPDFTGSMPGVLAKLYYQDWLFKLRASTNLKVEEGEFGAHMKVHIVNDGPVTVMLDLCT